jgi:hypothetical protein
VDLLLAGTIEASVELAARGAELPFKDAMLPNAARARRRRRPLPEYPYRDDAPLLERHPDLRTSTSARTTGRRPTSPPTELATGTGSWSLPAAVVGFGEDGSLAAWRS